MICQMGRLQDGERGIWLSSKAWEPGVPMSDVLKQEKTDASAEAERVNSPLLCSFVESGLSVVWVIPPAVVKALFTQSTDASANLFPEEPCRTHRSDALPAIWASLSPVYM